MATGGSGPTYLLNTPPHLATSDSVSSYILNKTPHLEIPLQHIKHGPSALLEHTGGERDLLGVNLGCEGSAERREREGGRRKPMEMQGFEGPKVRSHK